MATSSSTNLDGTLTMNIAFHVLTIKLSPTTCGKIKCYPFYLSEICYLVWMVLQLLRLSDHSRG
ncbi:hypothetical protein HanIR_Chr02g0087921 [Helianthus annuus]|nr:hypothetical protein HanIR_Chr02g0087921 [Helianthus annuus]